MSTKRFLLQKILQLFLTLFLVTAITFILMQLSPIDAAEAYSRRIFTVDETRIEAVREQMGLNRPIVVQYLDWLNDLLHFDLGNSYVDNRDVFLIVGSALKETACIVLLSAVLQAVGALILGILLYLTRKNVIGKILAFASIAAISIPAFYLATSFIDVVAVRWNLISVSGNTGLEPVFISDEAAQRHLQCGSLLPQLKLKFQTPLRDGEQHSSSQRCVRQSSATEVFPTHEA